MQENGFTGTVAAQLAFHIELDGGVKVVQQSAAYAKARSRTTPPPLRLPAVQALHTLSSYPLTFSCTARTCQ